MWVDWTHTSPLFSSLLLYFPPQIYDIKQLVYVIQHTINCGLPAVSLLAAKKWQSVVESLGNRLFSSLFCQPSQTLWDKQGQGPRNVTMPNLLSKVQISLPLHFSISSFFLLSLFKMLMFLVWGSSLFREEVGEICWKNEYMLVGPWEMDISLSINFYYNRSFLICFRFSAAIKNIF